MSSTNRRRHCCLGELGWCCLMSASTRTTELRGVRPRNLEQSTSFATSPRTVAEHLQAPAQDSAFPACVNHHPASLWLNSKFGSAYKYPDSTQLNSTAHKPCTLFTGSPCSRSLRSVVMISNYCMCCSAEAVSTFCKRWTQSKLTWLRTLLE